jgi:hypothetical protein
MRNGSLSSLIGALVAAPSRVNMPVLLAGHAGGFKTGRALAAPDQPTGALHASILEKLGIEAASYGNPAGHPIAGF